MKRIKANNSTSSFILLFLFFLIAIIFMLIFLHILSIKRNIEETSDIEVTSKVTTSETTTVKTTTEKVEVSFEASLEKILKGTELEKKYDVEVGYNDAIFNFKCATYDEENKVCESGSALMTIDDITYNLYTFASSTYDYSIRPNDYYIIVQDEYVILSMNKAGIEPGIMKIYNRKGKNLKDVRNYISGYLSGNNITNMKYPEYSDKKLSVYYCNKNKVYKTVLDFNNDFAVLSDEIINDVTCY
jgi:hypothetical protein